MYVFQNLLIALLGSAFAAYKVLVVPGPDQKICKAKPPTATAVVDLMLLITNNVFRHFLAQFFFSKLFDEEMDILGGRTIEQGVGALDQQQQADHLMIDPIE